MDVNCTNITASPAYNGQSVWISLSGAESLSVLPLVEVGQLVTCESSTEIGIVDRVDTYGHKFRVAPKQPNFAFASFNSLGQFLNYLKVDELLTITVE